MSAAPLVKKGVSPWADAWRRLRKNKAAMAGLVVVFLMGLACVFGPPALQSSTGLEPSYPFTWLRAQPPLSTHPDALQKSELALGEVPLVRPVYRDAARIELDALEAQVRDVRVVVRRGKVDEIRAGDGATELERLAVARPGFVREELESPVGGDPLGPELAGFELVKGQPLPEAFGPRKRSVVLLLREYLGAEARVTYAAETGLQAGPDGRMRRVVTALTRDGQPVERAAIEGRQVQEVRADGQVRVVRHWVGTDILGRDLLARILVGGRISLLVGIVATLVSLCIGVVYGAVSGYAGGRVDAAMMGAVDVLYGVPYMFLVIMLLTYFDRSIVMLFVALGCVQWLTMARIVRGQILSLKQKEFVEAARMSGTGPAGIVFGHLIPNTLGVVVVYTTLTVPAVILQESFLSFIGLNVTFGGEDWESWGALVSSGVSALGTKGDNAWLLIFPSLAMAMTLFSLNFLGDGLRDALDPRQRGRQ